MEQKEKKHTNKFNYQDIKYNLYGHFNLNVYSLILKNHRHLVRYAYSRREYCYNVILWGSYERSLWHLR